MLECKLTFFSDEVWLNLNGHEHTEILAHFIFIKCYFVIQKLASGAAWMSMVMVPVLCEMVFNLRGVRYCKWSNTVILL
jgi:hypothetical protein